jgi:hypothetical protein
VGEAPGQPPVEERDGDADQADKRDEQRHDARVVIQDHEVRVAADDE